MNKLSTHFLSALLILAALITPPRLSALWARPGVAHLSWTGPGCLYRVPSNQTTILIACYPREGGYAIELGSDGPLDAAYRPAAGDMYVLWRADGRKEQAPLRSVTYLPAIAR